MEADTADNSASLTAASKKTRRSRKYREGQPRFDCSEPGCNSSFSRMDHLRRHSAIHMDITRFICDACNRSFTRKDLVVRHKRIHEREESKNSGPKKGPSFLVVNSPQQQVPVSVQNSAISIGFVQSDSIQEQTINYSEADTHPISPARSLKSIGSSHQNELYERSPHSAQSDPTAMISPHVIRAEGHFVPEQRYSQLNSKGLPQATPSSAPGTNIVGTNSIQSEGNDSCVPSEGNSNSASEPGERLQNSSIPNRTKKNIGNNQITSYHLNENFIDWLIAQNEPASDPNQNPVSGAQTEGDGLSLPPLASNFEANSIIIPDVTSEPSVNGDVVGYDVCYRLINVINRPHDPLAIKFMTPAFIAYAESIYWSIHFRWPVLHKATFDIATAPSHLVLAMITLAMTLVKDPEAHQLAISIHETLRYSVYMRPEFGKEPQIWAHQTLLLVEVFELWASTASQHDMANRFHNVLPSSLRSDGIMDNLKASATELEMSDTLKSLSSTDEDLLEQKWRSYIQEEEKKRVAFYAFMLDNQQCWWFKMQPSVYLADLQFRLPCAEAVWDAPNAQAWKIAMRQHPDPPPPFLSTVSSYLRLRPPKVTLLPLAMTTVLYGLMSIAYSIQMRDQLVRVSGEEERLSKMVSQAYYSWMRQYKILFISTGKIPHDHPYFLGCMTVYEFAQMSLGVQILSVQRFVSVLSPHGCEPGDEEFFVKMKLWAYSGAAMRAIVHALDLIDLFLAQKTPYDAGKETAFHRPWAFYNAAIAVWAYFYIRRHDEKPVVLSIVDCLNYLRACVGGDSERMPDDDGGKSLLRELHDPEKIRNCNANPLIRALISALRNCRMPKLHDNLAVAEGLLTG